MSATVAAPARGRSPAAVVYCTTDPKDTSFVAIQGDNVAAGQYDSITGGSDNYACDDWSSVGGGHLNDVQDNGAATFSYIAGGESNFIESDHDFIGGGNMNTVGVGAYDGVLGGGYKNVVNGRYATIGGGDSNVASGTAATVPGGYRNLASGTFSFAAGYGSYANTSGSFVWSDAASPSTHLSPTAANQFLARATGGFTFITNANAAKNTGVYLAPGGGSWANLSDRNLKRNVTSVDDSAILAKLAALPVSEWSYVSQDRVRHLGPMAQDFYAAFGVGEDNRHITTVDEEGVALAAIKALREQNERLRQRVANDEAVHAEDAAHQARADARLSALEREIGATSRR